MLPALQLALLALGAYLLGAIPNGLLVGRLRGRDLLREGSGKTGSTNTLRVLGRPAAAAVFAGDLLKGLIAVGVAGALAWPDAGWRDLAVGVAGAAAIAGHNWSVWVRLLAGRWAGGRGLVPALGALLLVHPLVAAAGVLAAVLGVALTRYMVAGAAASVLVAFGSAAALAAAGQLAPGLLPGLVAWAALVLLGFHDNFARLARGQEPRLGAPH